MEQTGRLFKQRRLSTTWLKSQITQPHKLWDAMPKQRKRRLSTVWSRIQDPVT
ncbi:TPA: hypothetical protein RPA97_004086 [Escherichia coli]|nr:hypothetical protein [Escherichia coli]EJS0523534.1 hypothetical protein [Escherichia coli]NPO85138.1 hypothetical protein [Escherichia coli]HAJ8576212.1 hypothetical protein [Escherichia coli]HBI9449175.1 hypothetical protein [Escherichia coli]